MTVYHLRLIKLKEGQTEEVLELAEIEAPDRREPTNYFEVLVHTFRLLIDQGLLNQSIYDTMLLSLETKDNILQDYTLYRKEAEE